MIDKMRRYYPDPMTLDEIHKERQKVLSEKYNLEETVKDPLSEVYIPHNSYLSLQDIIHDRLLELGEKEKYL